MKIGKKIAYFRKKMELTQEELAEKLGVSSRSISRWENGNTMPELGILVELADYYEVDIREIIDGERKSEIMEKETKETLRKVADYAKKKKKLVVKRKCIVTFLGTVVFALSIAAGCILFPQLPEDSILRTDGLWMGIGITGLVMLWAVIINENRKTRQKEKQDN
mgnify:FL=1